MCDTLVALPSVTADRSLYFAKNSDREKYETQLVEVHAPRAAEPGARLRSTYLDLGDVGARYGCLLCRPYWMWGAEMGANSQGVVVGNEAVFSRRPASLEPALVGMDLVRLALEQADCAERAAQIIIDALERHGQGGNCGLRSASAYQNSFLIADPNRALVLETLDRDWAIKAVSSFEAISNTYAIDVPTAHSDSLSSNWAGKVGETSLADLWRDTSADHSGQRRRARSRHLLSEAAPDIDLLAIFGLLQDHGPNPRHDPNAAASDDSVRWICSHASDSAPRGQTVGSLVSQLTESGGLHWVTGTSAPCTSIFKPVWLDAPPDPALAAETARAAYRWNRHETLRALLSRAREPLRQAFYADRDRVQAEIVSMAKDTSYQPGTRRKRAAETCWRMADAFGEQQIDRLS